MAPRHQHPAADEQERRPAPRHNYRGYAVLVSGGARLCFTSQILGKFWNASTRPRDQNGFGLSVGETDCLTRVIERDFEFLPDIRVVHDRWRDLLVAHDVKGVQVHDARLAASKYVHGVTRLLTMNVRDFQRFQGVRAIHPAEALRQ